MTLTARNNLTKRWWDPWVAVLSVIAVVLVGARLWATEWTGNLHTLMFLAFFAGVAGLALGASTFSSLTAIIFSFVYGTYFTGWLFGKTMDAALSWHDRIVNVLGWRLQNAILQFFRGETVDNPILFLTLMAFLIWVISFLTTFIIVRKGIVWPVLVPLTISLFIIGHYDQSLAFNTGFLMVFLFIAFLLVGRVSFLHNKQNWQAEGIHTSAGAQQDVMRTLFGLAAFLIIVAALIPITAPAVDRYSKFWDTVTSPFVKLNDELYILFAVENPTKTIQSVYFGDSLALGSSGAINEEVVMVITPEDEEIPGYRNYWRARSYDTYLKSSWSSMDGFTEEKFLPNDFAIPYPRLDVGRTVTYTVTNRLDRMINLYAPGVLIWIDHPVEAMLQPLTENETDLITLFAEPSLREDDTYRVSSRVVVPSADALRTTGTEYPDWITLYLQLPADFSPDIAALAEEITKGLNSNYDKAQAITTYLRNTIEYSRTIPDLPKNVDPIEWFLFDGQTGFCNYYATSEVLMLRSLGIPARLSAGYAEGDYDSETNNYTVRKKDSHAWPEVYFQGYGWTVFEPTTSQRMVNYPSGNGLAGIGLAPSVEDDGVEERTNNPDFEEFFLNRMPRVVEPESEPASETTTTSPVVEETRSPIPKTTIIIVLIMLSVSVVVFLRPGTIKRWFNALPVKLERNLNKRQKKVPTWLHKWSCTAQLTDSEKAYLQISRSIKRLSDDPLPSLTPLERGEMLTALLPKSQIPVAQILNEYLLDHFSNHIVDVDYAKTAARQIRRMTTRARLGRIFQSKKNEELEDL